MATEVEKIIVRLIGDGSSYTATMKQASRTASQTAQQFDAAGRKWDASVGRFRDTTGKFVPFAETMRGKIAGIAGATTAVGTALTYGVTRPILGFARDSVDAFARFDQAMVESTSIMTTATDQQKAAMRDLAIELATTGKQGPTEIAEAYYFLASAGLDAERAMKAMPQVMAFATAGAFDMALATDLLTDAQSALGLSVKNPTKNLENMARVSDVLVRGATLANASVQQLSESLTNDAGPTLKSYNKDVEEGVAVLAAYADQGIKGLEAGSMMGRLTRMLASSALEEADAHKQLGFKVFDDATGKMRNYADIVANLEQITAGMSDQTKAATLDQLGFNALIQKAILPLLGASQKVREYESALRSAGGTTQQVAQNQMASFSNQIKLTKNILEGIRIEVASALAPALMFMNQVLQVGLQIWQQLPEPLKTTIILGALLIAVLIPMITAFAGLVTVVAMAWPYLAAVGTALAAISSWILPVVAVVLAVGTLVALLANVGYTLWKTNGDWEAALGVIEGFFKGMVDYGSTGLRILWRLFVAWQGWMAGVWERVFTKDFLFWLYEGLKTAAMKYLDFKQYVYKQLASIFTGEEVSVQGFLDTVKGDFQAGKDNLNFASTASNIIGEEWSALQAQRAAQQPVNVQQIDPPKDTQEQKNLEGIEQKMQELVELAAQQNEKPVVNLEPINLGS